MRKIIILLIALLIIPAIKTYCQPNPSSRKYLKQLIREGQKSNFPGIYSIMACNEDSLFFKNDTVGFYDNVDYFSKIGICCEFIQWEFIDNDIIHQQEPQNCMDPSNLSVSSIHYFGFRIRKNKRNIYLDLYTDKRQFDTFLVKNIEYMELPGAVNCRGITLIRQSDKIQSEQQNKRKKITL